MGFKVKMKRQEVIEKIITNYEICTQEALQISLKEMGFDVTQATVSRDIKSMGLTKVLSESGKYCYAISRDTTARGQNVKFYSVFLEAVIAVDYAQNIVAVKCHVGMGNAACAALDRMDLGDVVGTLAGDDTIFILLHTTEEACGFVEKLHEILGR